MKRERVEIRLPQSAKDFLDYLKVVRNRSEETISEYETDLRIFFDFMTTYKKKSKINVNFIKGITLIDLYKFLNNLDKKGNAPATRARKVASIRSYFKFLKKIKIINDNVADELESPKINHVQPEVLDVNESLELLSSVDKDNLNYERNYCILTLFLNCGMRLSELNNIKLNDIKEDVLTIIGKGSKERKVYLNKSCLNAISQYLNVRDDSKCSLEDKQYLFLSIRNKKIYGKTIQHLVKKHLREAGMDTDKLHTHSMRASFATMNHKAGADIVTLARAMGHANINTTKMYVNIDENDLRRLANNNPLTCI